MPSKDRRSKEKCCSGKYCSSCFYSIFQPFSPSNSRGDGNTLSLLYLCCLTTIGVVLNISSWLQKDRFSKTNIVTHDHINGFLMTCILPSFIWMFYYAIKNPGKSTVEFLDVSVHYQDPFICGVYIFGTGSILLQILQIAYYVGEGKTEVISLLFTIFNAIFTVTQVIFLKKYSKASFQDDQMIRMALLHILSTNVILFFHTLLATQHSGQHLKEFEQDKLHNHTFNIPKFLNLLQPYLYPFLVEFPMCSVGVVYGIWSDLKELEPKPDDIYIDDELTEINTMDSELLEGEKFLDTRNALSPLSPFHSPRIRKSMSNVIIHQSKFDIMKRCVGFGLLFGLLFSVFLLAVIGITAAHPSKFTVTMFYISEMVYLLLMCASCWTILKGLLSQMYCWFEYSAIDTVLLFSLISVLFQQGFTFTSSIAQIYISVFPRYILTLSSIEILECMLQTSTIIRALRFRIGYKSSLVREASLFLMICNIVIWLQRCFLDPKTPFLSLVQRRFYGKEAWDILFLLTYPFQIFFRFHSAICLYNIWSIFNE